MNLITQELDCSTWQVYYVLFSPHFGGQEVQNLVFYVVIFLQCCGRHFKATGKPQTLSLSLEHIIIQPSQSSQPI